MMLMAFALPSYAQTYRSSNNATLGTVSSDGTVRNSSNSRIGKIDSDGTVRNANNSAIGKAQGIDKKIAAAIFFMDLLK